MTNTTRRLEFAWFTLAGIPSYGWCLADHICRCGHLAHNANPRAAGMYDLIFMACFVAAAMAAIRSDMARRFLCLALLVTLLVSRMGLDSWGGGLIIIEIPALIFLAGYAVATIRRVRHERGQQTSESIVQHGTA